MAERVLITGGAGFIGSHTANALLKRGFAVRVLDNLHPQIHGKTDAPPTYLSDDVEFIKGDIRNRAALETALDGVSVVYHFAAETGVGQSMYEVGRYVDVNVNGTAVLWDAVASHRETIRKVILSSSRAVYGEGMYRCEKDGIVFPPGRHPDDLARQDWSMKCPVCGAVVESIPTTEAAALHPTSVYAQTKKFQEEICHLMGGIHGIPVVALRYFNVYGSRQALTNPYTGVIATFCTRLLNGHPIILYEGGVPQRDFVHVSDVVQANLLALDYGGPETYMVFNVGSGVPLTLQDIAGDVCAVLERDPDIQLSARHRIGDILSCYADLQRTRELLGYEPQVTFRDGMHELVAWLGDDVPPDRSEAVAAELKAKGLMLDD
jgi:dTDP-L-rhamnose 4-epimerase